MENTNSIYINQYDYQNLNDNERELFISMLKTEITKKNNFFEKKLSEFDIYSDDYIKTYIYYYLHETNFNSTYVDRFLQRTKTLSKLNNNYNKENKEKQLFNMIIDDDFKENMIDDYEDKEITLENKMETFFHNYFKLDDKDKELEEYFIYLNRMSNSEYNEFINIFKLSMEINYDLNNFLTKFTSIFFENKYILKCNVLEDVMRRIKNDNNLSLSFQKYIINSIISFIIKEE